MEIEKDFGGMLEETETLSDTSKNYLLEVAKWSSFFGILGFIFCGIIVIVAIFFIFFMGSFDTTDPAFQKNGFSQFTGTAGVGFASVYLIFGLLYFFPSLYIFKSSKAIKHGLLKSDSNQLEEGFKNLKSTFKYWGVFTIITIALYAILFIITSIGRF